MKSGEVFIVEGQMDTISLHQAGVENAVGISGTALTQEHIRILKRFTKIIYLALDADNAGVKATFLSIENLLNSDIEIRVIIIPNGKDPDDFIKSGGDFMDLKNHSLSAIEYYMKMWEREYNTNTMVGQKQLIEKCIELVARIASPIEVDFYIKHIAEVFDISRDSLYETLRQKKSQALRKQSQEQKNPETNTKYAPKNTDLLAGMISKFSLLDLFFQKFAYNKDDILQLGNASLLHSVITEWSIDDTDAEELKTLDVYIDEMFPDKHPDIIQRQFFDLLRGLHTALLEKEKNNLLSSIDSSSPEYLEAYTYLVRKAMQLGIPPGNITQ